MKVFQHLEARQQWSPEERLALEQVQRVSAEVLAPNAERYDRTGDFPWDNVKALNALGLNTIFIPEVYGGTPMSYRL
jgi:alkylation response protein AidB-like acyl-CoA dehydrogenase